MKLSTTQKQLLGHALGVVVNALVLAFVKNPEVQVAALGVWGAIATALHIPRPQDTTPVQLDAKVDRIVRLAAAEVPAASIKAALK